MNNYLKVNAILFFINMMKGNINCGIGDESDCSQKDHSFCRTSIACIGPEKLTPTIMQIMLWEFCRQATKVAVIAHYIAP